MKRNVTPNLDKIAHVHLRVRMADKSKWVKVSNPGKLAEWCIEVLNAAAKADLADMEHAAKHGSISRWQQPK